MINKSKAIKVITFVFLLAAGFFAYRKLSVHFMNDMNTGSSTAAEDLGVVIEAAAVLKEDLNERISYVGTLYPKDTMQAAAAIPAEILEIYMDEGDYVRKGQIMAKLEDENIIAAINTLQAKIDTVEFNLAYNRAFSHIVKDINAIIGSYPMPKGYTAEMSGEQEKLGDAMGDMIFSLALAVVVVLGFILLTGTVVNNSILLIDFAVSFREKGFSVEESLVEGVKSRFRPIMMTALSDVTGMLPLAMQLALGAERFSPLAITVTGGMIAATLLTMIIIPVIYASLEAIRSGLSAKAAALSKKQ